MGSTSWIIQWFSNSQIYEPGQLPLSIEWDPQFIPQDLFLNFMSVSKEICSYSDLIIVVQLKGIGVIT